MNKLVAGLLCALCISSFSAHAGFITVESVKLDNGLSTKDFSSYWESVLLDPNSVIKTEDIVDATLIYNGSAHNNTFYKLTAEFGASLYDTMSFFAGFDAGYGAEIFFNSSIVSDVDSNIWWARNFNNAIEIEDLDLLSGLNTLEVYWAENGNSGGNSFELSFDQNQRMALAASNLPTIPSVSTASIPEPSTLALLAIATIAFGFSRKKSAKNITQ